MRRIVISLLILTTLYSGLAWSMDSCLHDAQGHHLSDNGDGDSPDSSNATGPHHCLHCCHALAHLTGMTSHALAVTPATTDSAPLFLADNYYSLRPPPDTEPPIAI